MKRREFVKNLGVLASAGALSQMPWYGAFSEVDATQDSLVRIAVIGVGSRGQYLLQLALACEKAKVVALCDNYAPSLESGAVLAPEAKLYTDYRALLDDPSIQGVIIATPPITHTAIALDAYAAGKNVFVEKSIALTMDETLQLYNAHKAAGKILFVGQQRLFDPRYIVAMKMLHEGSFGDIQTIRAFWDRNTDWRRTCSDASLERQINWRLFKDTSHGMMTELACHQLQVGMWAMRSIPNRVMGVGGLISRGNEREVYDNMSLIYQFDNGVTMSYASTNGNKFYGLEEQILCQKGTFEIEKGKYYYEEVAPAPAILQLINEVENKLFNSMPMAGTSWVPETANENTGYFLLGKRPESDGTDLLIAAFVEANITQKQPESLAEEAYYATQLSLLGHQAMEQNQVLTFPDQYKLNYLNHVAL